jgi:hypothetical protein
MPKIITLLADDHIVGIETGQIVGAVRSLNEHGETPPLLIVSFQFRTAIEQGGWQWLRAVPEHHRLQSGRSTLALLSFAGTKSR